MPRKQSPERKKARELFNEHNGNISNREIAGILGLSEKTIGGWKSKDNWTGKIRSTPKENNRSTPKKKGGQPGNKNATGPPRNQHAKKHGLFSKWLPDEINEIIGLIPEDPLDILWHNIQMLYANIIHSQEILYVSDKSDKTKEKTMDGDNVTAYEYQQSWDKQAGNMGALSRAMKTLESMIKQYEDLISKGTGMASEEQRARIDQLKAQTAKLETDNDKTPDEGIKNQMDAITGIINQMQPPEDEVDI